MNKMIKNEVLVVDIVMINEWANGKNQDNAGVSRVQDFVFRSVLRFKCLILRQAETEIQKALSRKWKLKDCEWS